MLWPDGTKERPRITTKGAFGWRVHPITGKRTFHYGTDMVGFTLNRAIAAGTVVAVSKWDGLSPGRTKTPAGNKVTIQHDGFRSIYMHNDSLLVRKGDVLTEGDPVGPMGATGAVTGRHLHLAIVVDGAYVDPVPFITARLGGTAGGSITPEDDMSAEAERLIKEIHNLLTPGAAGGKQQGAVHKQLSAIASTVSDAKGAAVKAQAAAEGLAADFQAGQSGVRKPGRLLSLLSRTQAEVQATNAALTALATAKGADPDAILKVVEEGVKEAMRGITFTTDVDG